MNPPLPLVPEVLALTNRERGHKSGILYEGHLAVEVLMEHEVLADACIRRLREMEIDLQTGDMLFFPQAAAGHRCVDVP